MDKRVFDLVQKYNELKNKLYFKLDKLGLDMDTIEELLENFGDLHDKTLKLGEYSDREATDKETYLTQQYEDIERYIKVNVIYEYDNGFTLCNTTAGSLHLIPKEYLADY
ncbi:hypothetical protein [Oceanobacillus sp. FSL H7-0719]|uniref:hypothetical protein n=1 Tax=Oceanobacillus sp. FSL H7-0719 TaxID=2954507 RepID=UPI0032499DF1